MNGISVGFVSPFQSVLLQVMAPLYNMAIWQIQIQNMADAGYHIVGTDVPYLNFNFISKSYLSYLITR